jgi:serine/threonine-protein kinase
MLSGTQPFAAPDDRSATQRIRHDPPPPLARTAPQVPAVLERIVQRCLEKMPSDRFQSAAELALALESTSSELGPGASQHAVRSALERAGLSAEVRKSLGEIAPPLTSARRRLSLIPALRGLLLCFGLLVVGGGVIQYFAWRAEGVPAARGGIGKLELVPRRQGYLRVVADPWAHVFVDGQRVDTTPFARSVPLEAGVHYVKLEHPQAPTERRTVRIALGETVLLDVKMKLYAPQIDAGEDEVPEELLEAAEAGSDAAPSP